MRLSEYNNTIKQLLSMTASAENTNILNASWSALEAFYRSKYPFNLSLCIYVGIYNVKNVKVVLPIFVIFVNWYKTLHSSFIARIYIP